MSPEMQSALKVLRDVIVREHPSTVEATVTFTSGGRVQVDIEERSEQTL